MTDFAAEGNDTCGWTCHQAVAMQQQRTLHCRTGTSTNCNCWQPNEAFKLASMQLPQGQRCTKHRIICCILVDVPFQDIHPWTHLTYACHCNCIMQTQNREPPWVQPPLLPSLPHTIVLLIARQIQWLCQDHDW